MRLSWIVILALFAGCASAPKEREAVNLYLPKVKYAE
jgi:hypothetical protein